MDFPFHSQPTAYRIDVVITIAAVLFGVLTPALNADHLPKWVDTKIAGYVFEPVAGTTNICVFDTKSGYYFLRNGECDGAYVSLVLTRDRKIISDYGYAIPGYKSTSENEPYLQIKNRPLSNLSTGKGIRIGDKPATVMAKLGKPKTISLTGGKFQFTNYIYEIEKEGGTNHAGDTTAYTETYTFKTGKLIEITFDRDLNFGD